MPSVHSRLFDGLTIARDSASGARVGFGQRLANYREFLHLLAVAEISPAARRRLEPSDIVQQTMLEAYEKRGQFQGATDRELAEWLRQMLRHNIQDGVRAMRRQKRDVTRERPLAGKRDDSQLADGDWLSGNLTSPSQKLLATEDLLQMSRAIASLPGDQRQAVIMHHLQGQTLAELAAYFNRHPSAVAGLLHRGLKKLRESLQTHSNG